MKPMGLTQADYEELENPRPAAEPFSPLPPFTLWDKCLSLLAFALALVLVLFLYVAAHLCRMVSRKSL